MLYGTLLHPEILRALGRCGHGSQVLIADGNYPLSTATHPETTLVYLNLAPGRVDCVEVLQSLLTASPFEAAAVMRPTDKGPHALPEEPPVWTEFAAHLQAADCTAPLQRVERFAFYEAARSPNVALAIATGEQRIYANLLLTIGVRL